MAKMPFISEIIQLDEAALRKPLSSYGDCMCRFRTPKQPVRNIQSAKEEKKEMIGEREQGKNEDSPTCKSKAAAINLYRAKNK